MGKTLLVALASLLGSAILSTPSAAAQTQQLQPTQQQVQCSVGYVRGPQHVVLTFGSYNAQGLVDLSASACTDLIATGDWVGADNRADWPSRGYQLLCTVPFGPTSSADVYALPYTSDRLVGYQMCNDGKDLTIFNNVGPALDAPR